MGKIFPFLIKLVTGKTTEDLFQPLSYIKQSKQGSGRMKRRSSGESWAGREVPLGPSAEGLRLLRALPSLLPARLPGTACSFQPGPAQPAQSRHSQLLPLRLVVPASCCHA